MNIQEEEKQWASLTKDNKGWEDPIFSIHRRKEKEYDLYIQSPLEVVEGVLLCKKCGSKKVLSFQTQTRSADEPMTTIAKCLGCGSEWRENN